MRQRESQWSEPGEQWSAERGGAIARGASSQRAQRQREQAAATSPRLFDGAIEFSAFAVMLVCVENAVGSHGCSMVLQLDNANEAH